MRTRDRTGRKDERGTTLLEAMISLSVLLIGLLGMAGLQIFGIGTTQGARAHTIATQLASELGAALTRLETADHHLDGAEGVSPNTPPTTFARLLPLGVPTTALVHVWSDATPIPGARLDSALERDPEDVTRAVYQRRWTVWDAGVTANGTVAKVVAVSVIYRERMIATPKEVVLYVHSEVRGNFMANVNAFN